MRKRSTKVDTSSINVRLEQRNITQKQFAATLKISEASASRIIDGKQKPSELLWRNISLFLDLDLETGELQMLIENSNFPITFNLKEIEGMKIPETNTPYNTFEEWQDYKKSIRSYYNGCIKEGVIERKVKTLYPKLYPFINANEYKLLQQRKPLSLD